MPNKYKCKLTGKSYSEATIKSNLSAAYKDKYLFELSGLCEGCSAEFGVCSAHIIAKARCKQLHLTSLIWNPENFFRSCHECNLKAELPSSEEIKKLKNYDRILEVTKKWDKERYQKMI